jgi:hypothetical protein
VADGVCIIVLTSQSFDGGKSQQDAGEHSCSRFLRNVLYEYRKRRREPWNRHRVPILAPGRLVSALLPAPLD